jgi:LmbE family N-acetylglucosaminyl deacetylase
MRRLKERVPHWAILVAFDFRCLLRRWRVGRKAPFRRISKQPALVIAPHPDDETFGCGALISLKRQAGIPVRVVFLTSGEAVGSGIDDKPETIIRARQAQAFAACRHLGVEAADVNWLDLPDGKLPRGGQPGFDEAVERLLAELKKFSVGEVFCPHPNDIHRDHEVAAELARKAVELSGMPWRLIYYPVWIWYHASSGLGRRLVTNGAWRLDGGLVKAKKAAAMAEYFEAPKAASGKPYCGKLPWGFLWNFRNASEVFFETHLRDQF